MTVRAPRRWQVLAATGGLLLGAATVAVAAVAHDGGQASVHLVRGGAWAANGSQQTLVHVDGALGRTDATVPDPGMADSVVTQTAHGLIVRETDGRTVLVDLASLAPSQGPATTVPTGPVDSVGDGTGAYSIGVDAGTVDYVGTDGAHPAAATVGGPLYPHTVVDAGGTAYLLDPGTGRISTFSHGVAGAAFPGPTHDGLALASAGGKALLLDSTTGTVSDLGPTGVGAVRLTGLPIAAGAQVSRGAPVPLVAVVSGQSLAVGDLAHGTVVVAPLPTGTYGEPRLSADTLYLPDTADGSLLVLDPATGHERGTPVAFKKGGGAFGVTVGEDGLAYLSDPTQNRAVVVHSDGMSASVQTGPAPTATGAGPSGGTVQLAVPPAPKPTPRPSAKPSNQVVAPLPPKVETSSAPVPTQPPLPPATTAGVAAGGPTGSPDASPSPTPSPVIPTGSLPVLPPTHSPSPHPTDGTHHHPSPTPPSVPCRRAWTATAPPPP